VPAAKKPPIKRFRIQNPRFPILRRAAAINRPLEVALTTWGEVTFDYASTDAPDAVPTPSR